MGGPASANHMDSFNDVVPRPEDPRKKFYESCPHRLDGFNWSLITPDSAARRDSGGGLFVPSGRVPQTFSFALCALNPIGNERRHTIMTVNMKGDMVTYFEDSKEVMRKSTKGISVKLEGSNRFIVHFAKDPRPYVHVCFEEAYREEVVQLLNICSSTSFSKFDVEMVCLHEGNVQLRGQGRFSAWFPRYVRLVNSRLLVYRSIDSDDVLESINVAGFHQREPKDKCTFKVKSAARKFTFKVDSANSMDTWMQAMLAAQERWEIERHQLYKQGMNMRGGANSVPPVHKSTSFEVEQLLVGSPKKNGALGAGQTGKMKDVIAPELNGKHAVTIGDGGDQVPDQHPKRGFEIHSIMQGNDKLLNQTYQHWEQIFVYALQSVDSAGPIGAATLLHVNLANRTAEYFNNEEIVAERKLAGANARLLTTDAARFVVTYEGTGEEIVHTLCDASTRPELMALLRITSRPSFQRLHVPSVCVHKGACEKRGKSTLWWNYRYLIAINGRLLVYRGADAKIPIHATSLMQATIEANDSLGPNQLAIKRPDHELRFRFSSKKERDVWIKAMGLSVSRGHEERKELFNQASMLAQADSVDASSRGGDGTFGALFPSASSGLLPTDLKSSTSLESLASSKGKRAKRKPAHGGINNKPNLKEKAAAAHTHSSNESLDSLTHELRPSAAATSSYMEVPARRAAAASPGNETSASSDLGEMKTLGAGDLSSSDGLSEEESVSVGRKKKPRSKMKTGSGSKGFSKVAKGKKKKNVNGSAVRARSAMGRVKKKKDAEQEDEAEALSPRYYADMPHSTSHNSGLAAKRKLKWDSKMEVQVVPSVMAPGSGGVPLPGSDPPTPSSPSTSMSVPPPPPYADLPTPGGSDTNEDDSFALRMFGGTAVAPGRSSLKSRSDVPPLKDMDEMTAEAQLDTILSNGTTGHKNSVDDPKLFGQSKIGQDIDSALRVDQPVIPSSYRRPKPAKAAAAADSDVMTPRKRVSLDRLNTPGGPDTPRGLSEHGYEVRVDCFFLGKDTSVPVGFVELSGANASLESLREGINMELDDVPDIYVFLRGDVPIGQRQEAKKTVRHVVNNDDVVFIRALKSLS